MESDEDKTLYSVVYEYQDVLGGELGEDPNDFVSEHRFNIYSDLVEPDGKAELVGRGSLSMLHFGLAMDVGFPLRDVMDATASILAMSESLFSWEEDADPFDKLDAYFEDDPIFNRDVCFVERLEVLPAYRGRGIGRNALISIGRKFYNGCGLVVLKAYPLQHEARDPGEADVWVQAMRYDALEQDLERAQYQLFNWYQQMGLSNPFYREYFMTRPEMLARLAEHGRRIP